MARRLYAGAATDLLSPQQVRHLSPPSITYTLHLRRGDTMYRSSPILQFSLTAGGKGGHILGRKERSISEIPSEEWEDAMITRLEQKRGTQCRRSRLAAPFLLMVSASLAIAQLPT